MALPKDIQRASVLSRCANPLPANIVSQYGKRIIKVSDHEVVKWGPDITKEEADNQRLAYELMDSHLVRVPRVYDFFSDEQGRGYIVMEYIEGKSMDLLEDSAALQKVVDVLDYFATLRHTNPGPLCGGPCRGLLFPETEDLVFDNLDEMEKWFNSRLLPDNPKLSFQGCDLVFCHLDLAPRNILLQKDGSLCLIDWASAGYYPRLFEFCVQWIVEGRDDSFNSLLLESVKPLSAQEMAQKTSILCAWRNIQKYPFQNGNSKSVGRSTDFIRLSPPPMPKYPPGQYEQAQDECFAHESYPLAASSSSALEVGKQNKVHNTLTRYLRHLRSIFVPRNKLSEID